jgi:probable addiction module antidote protein
MPDIKQACFLRDDASQILTLSDALSSANGPAISKAFDAVARTKGLAQIAREAEVSLEDLHRALADPARPDTSFLARVLESLISERQDTGDETLPRPASAPT